MDFKDKEELKRIDKRVGKNLRKLRIYKRISQKDLGDKIGITFQQIQKYENGANRISASRLFAMSRYFEVPVSTFFDGLDTPFCPPRLPSAKALALARRIDGMPDNKAKTKLGELVHAMDATAASGK